MRGPACAARPARPGRNAVCIPLTRGIPCEYRVHRDNLRDDVVAQGQGVVKDGTGNDSR